MRYLLQRWARADVLPWPKFFFISAGQQAGPACTAALRPICLKGMTCRAAAPFSLSNWGLEILLHNCTLPCQLMWT